MRSPNTPDAYPCLVKSTPDQPQSRRRTLSGLVLAAIVLSACEKQSVLNSKDARAILPSVLPGDPVSGSGLLVNVAATFHDESGPANLNDLFLVINDPSKGVDGTAGCAIWCNRKSAELFLLDDAGKNWLTLRNGAGHTLRNSQCAVSPDTTGLAEEAGNLKWVTSITFSRRFPGLKKVWAKATNRQNHESNFTMLGTWIVSDQ
jgi:hypothetical protein